MHHNRIWGKLFWGIEWVIDLSEITSLRQLYILSFLSWELGLHRQWDWLTMNWLIDWLIDSLISHTRFEYPLGVRHFSRFWGILEWTEYNSNDLMICFGWRLEKSICNSMCTLTKSCTKCSVCTGDSVRGSVSENQGEIYGGGNTCLGLL